MTRGRQGKAQKEAAAERGTSGAATGYEAELWRMADALRGSMDAAEYKHVVLGLIFLKYISDAFEERHTLLEGTVKLTDLWTYSAPWTLHKLLILRSSADRFRLQNPRIPLNLTVPPERLVCDSHVTVVRCLFVSSEYIRTWLRTGNVYGLIEERAAGSTNQVELTAQMALNQIVPLPPLAEQHRIVAKVDELMALCDRLGVSLATGNDTRRCLLDALLYEALEEPPEAFKGHHRCMV